LKPYWGKPAVRNFREGKHNIADLLNDGDAPHRTKHQETGVCWDTSRSLKANSAME